MEITIGSVVILKVREMEDKAQRGESRRPRKKVVGCV